MINSNPYEKQLAKSISIFAPHNIEIKKASPLFFEEILNPKLIMEVINRGEDVKHGSYEFFISQKEKIVNEKSDLNAFYYYEFKNFKKNSKLKFKINIPSSFTKTGENYLYYKLMIYFHDIPKKDSKYFEDHVSSSQGVYYGKYLPAISGAITIKVHPLSDLFSAIAILISLTSLAISLFVLFK